LFPIRQALDLYVNLRPVRLFRGIAVPLASQTALFTREGIARVLDHGFRLGRELGLVASVTKSNALAWSMTLWDEVAEEVAAAHPDGPWERMHVDAVAYRMVKDPWRFRVLVASNLFGDILSDLGAALGGSIGCSPSANLHPGRHPHLFEPVHGSAPDLAGRRIATPVGAVWSARASCGRSSRPRPA
jgi:tartrate dehydrogenase/decarboxylase/D-malate dehydrogenase